MLALRRLDDAVAALERLLIVVLLSVMVLAVFLDTAHRTFSGSAAGATAAFAVAAFAVAYGALAGRVPGASRRRPLALAAAVSAAAVASSQALVRLLPGGLVFSQQMALSFMLWVGLVGASLGARERAHVAFELAGRLWPPRARPAVEWIARVVSAAFCIFLALLALTFTRGHYVEWVDSGGAAGLFEAFRVPRWTIYGFLPFPFTVMGLRFLLHGLRDPP